MIDQRLEFLGLSVIAYANDWRLCVLDDLDQGSDTAAVASTNAIDLVHDDDGFLGCDTTDG